MQQYTMQIWHTHAYFNYNIRVLLIVMCFKSMISYSVSYKSRNVKNVVALVTAFRASDKKLWNMIVNIILIIINIIVLIAYIILLVLKNTYFV